MSEKEINNGFIIIWLFCLFIGLLIIPFCGIKAEHTATSVIDMFQNWLGQQRWMDGIELMDAVFLWLFIMVWIIIFLFVLIVYLLRKIRELNGD